MRGLSLRLWQESCSRESQDRTATWKVAFDVQQSISCEGCNYNCNQRWHCASRKLSRNSIVGNNCSVVLGSTGRVGEIQPTAVKGGDKVFHPKCRGPKAMLGNKDSLLFRDGATLETHVIEVTLWCPGKLPILLKF